MSFDEIFDLTAGVYFHFLYYLLIYPSVQKESCRGSIIFSGMIVCGFKPKYYWCNRRTFYLPLFQINIKRVCGGRCSLTGDLGPRPIGGVYLKKKHYTPAVRSKILSKLIFASDVWYSDRAYCEFWVLIKCILCGRHLFVTLTSTTSCYSTSNDFMLVNTRVFIRCSVVCSSSMWTSIDREVASTRDAGNVFLTKGQEYGPNMLAIYSPTIIHNCHSSWPMHNK